MRTIGVVTVSRSDYGLYLPVLRLIEKDPELQLHLMVSGMHLLPDFGLTVEEIGKDGFKIAERIEMLEASDTPEAIARSMGRGTAGFADAFSRFKPDILLVLGDRFEIHAAVVAALPFKIPVAHIHGGEVTEGAIDDALRHSITKMSHLHFVSTEDYARRVRQLGEESWRITVSGAPGLDNLKNLELLGPEDLEKQFGLVIRESFLLVTYHPVTLEYEQTEWQMRQLLGALEQSAMDIIFTYPNSDTQGRTIIRMIEEFASQSQRAQVVKNLGTRAYFSLMSHAAAMVGNSSSGIIEAPSFILPVVNIGSRQKGRIRTANVVDVGYGQDDIRGGIRKAVSAEFRAGLEDLKNPYGDGHSAERIIKRLKETQIDDKLIVKRFWSVGGQA